MFFSKALSGLLLAFAVREGFGTCEREEWKNDGYCDEGNNNESCDWDESDCCECICGDDGMSACIFDAFLCRDPDATCYDAESPGVLYPDCQVEVFTLASVGDGYCDPPERGLNVESCGFDGGDCCSCTCNDGTYMCGEAPKDCRDESAECYDDDATCDEDEDCDTDNGFICCPVTKVCEEQPISPGACGDPHMTGFRGQKFDFTGEDGGWYSVVSALPDLHLNMRVTSPVPSVPEITYITGISIMTTDGAGVDHTIVISVADPHSLDSACPAEVSPCLAEGALRVELDGEASLAAPGVIALGPDVAIAAVNLPGACRTFGFEKYWEQKKQAEYALTGRRLTYDNGLKDMAEWILDDPTATNMEECVEYVTKATAAGGDIGLFAHDSEHASFQILTPVERVRLSHGRLHQVAMRDPTDQFDLPDHLTWQMNLAIDHHNIDKRVARGILGETLVPTVDASGKLIMQGMDSIRGSQEDYRVEGPLGTAFALDAHHA